MNSKKWKTWKAMMDDKICFTCKKMNGKIYDMNEKPNPTPPVHLFCRCIITKLKSKMAGTATALGVNGADWYLKMHNKLPDYYISVGDAKDQGWIPEEGNLAIQCPNKMIFGGMYMNRDGHLPSAPGRIWYEADICYVNGYRGVERIVFSNDGIIFVTYDHYRTFYEIV
ncbi:MAG: phage head morphogenesis protein [Clostridia bacterium]|nr:phage head morphogenesis protein [Clostridia bacterium]